MTTPDLPPEFIDFLHSIQSKRPRTVIDHILEHGYITTEELKTRYGYNHPPRAARDVREQGVPLVTFRVPGSDGRKIAAYKFGDPAAVQKDKLGGRKNIPKRFKDRLIEEHATRCAICLEIYDSGILQVDHRIPYQVGGDEEASERRLGDYLLLCGSCNRAKSWSCESCQNWNEMKSAAVCAVCYWASPEAYEHIAMKPMRRLEIVWQQDETADFEEIKRRAEHDENSLQAYVKAVLARHLRAE
jgi:hypothetical protein